MSKITKNFFISTCLYLLFLAHASQALAMDQANSSCSIEFLPSEQELVEMSKWNDSTYDVMVQDAFNGDAAGLFMIGYACLTGRLDQAIDVERANRLFCMSASLGYAPALEQVKNMYIDDKRDPYLAMVYLNLTISYGHYEFLAPYHDMRAKFVQYYGPEKGQRILKEIERIATEKRTQIQKNLEELEKHENQVGEYFNKVIFSGNITMQDCFYTDQYWNDISVGKTINERL